jgi:hypothetical protein
MTILGEAIARIGALDWPSASIDDIKEALRPALEGHQVVSRRFHPGLHMFRARVCGSERPQNIRDLSYPPPALVGLGRVNRPRQPVLYCSSSTTAAISETRPPVGSTIAVVEWETTEHLAVNHVGYTQETFHALGSDRALERWDGQAVDIHHNTPDDYITAVLATLFTQRIEKGEESLYKVSVAVAELLFSDDLFSGLLYPTVQMRAHGDNIAVKTPFADAHLRFVIARLMRVDSQLDFGYRVTALDTARVLGDDGSIKWRGRPDTWTIPKGHKMTFVLENGFWVPRDSDGNFIPPDE